MCDVEWRCRPSWVVGLLSLAAVVVVSEEVRAQEVPVTLQEVLEEVPQRYESWEITEQQIRQSQAARREVLGALLPQVNVSGSVNRGPEVEVGGSTVQRRYNWGVTATGSIALFNGPRYFDLWQAEAMLRATEEGVAWQRHLILLEAELAYYTLAAAQRGVEIAESAIDLRREYLAQAEALVDAGMAVRLDVSRARSQILEAEQALLEAEVILGDAAANLAYLMGRERDAMLRADLDPEVAVPPVPEAIAEISEERVDLQGRRSAIEATELQRRGIWWGLAPTLSFQVQQQLGPSTLFNPDGATFTMGLQASWNLYDGGARYARVDQAVARIREQELQLEQELRRANTQREQALRQWRQAEAAIAVAQEQVEVARETFEMVSARFESGLATSLEVSDASQELLRAELRLNQIRLQSRLAEVQYRYMDEVEQ